MGVTSGADETQMQTFLVRRGATYYFRRVIPERLRPKFEGKRELVFSLKTKDRKDAVRLCRAEAVRTDKLFELAEGKLFIELGEKATEVEALSVQQLASRIANSWRRERQRCAADGLLPSFEERVRQALRDHEAVLRGDYPDFPAYPLSSSEAMVIAARAILTGEGAASLPEVIPTVPKAQSVGSSITLTQLVDRWSAENRPTEKSVQMWRRTCRDFDGFSGSLRVGEIKKAHVLGFKDLMLAAGSSPATIQNRLNQLRSLFRYAERNDLVAADPTVGVKAPVSKRAKDSRLPFDAVSLKALFSGPVHSAGQRPERGGGEASYWLPLIALFTGARLNEIGQLRTKDILLESYPREGVDTRAWVFRITADETDGLTLKNRGSARRIPIHAALVELGFLRYVQAIKEEGHLRLFPALKPDRFGTVTANWSKWFSIYMRSQSILDRKIVFHSFRHSFKHYARESEIPKSVNDALTGHESGDVADNYGGPDYPLKPLVDAISIYRVSSFDLTKLTRPSYIIDDAI